MTALRYAQSEEISAFETLLESMTGLLNNQLDPIEAREALLKLQSLPVLLTWMQKLVNWMLRFAQTGDAHAEAPWRGYQRQFNTLSRRLTGVSQTVLFELYDELLELKRQDLDVVNPAMLMDKWLISFSRRLS